jgi:hypothetical protein
MTMCIEMFGNIHRPYDQPTPELTNWDKQKTSARGMQKTVRGQKEIENLMHEDEKKLIAECLVTLKRVEKIIHELG